MQSIRFVNQPMIRFSIIIVVVVFTNTVFATKDSTPFLKFNNHLEYGETVVNAFNKDGFVPIHPLWNYYVSYTRHLFKRKIFLKGDVHNYSVGNTFGNNNTGIKDRMRGDVMHTEFRVIRLSSGHCFQYHKFLISPYIDIGYRWGRGETVFWKRSDWNPYEPVNGISKYNSIGIGAGCSAYYIFCKRFTLGVESRFDYFFQKNNLIVDGNAVTTAEYNYIPRRSMLTFHLKAGVMF